MLDGRDIGTVIAPEADVKLFVTASPEVRAERRMKELEARGMNVGYEDVLGDIRARDQRNSYARNSPALAGNGRDHPGYEWVERRRSDRKGAAHRSAAARSGKTR